MPYFPNPFANKSSVQHNKDTEDKTGNKEVTTKKRDRSSASPEVFNKKQKEASTPDSECSVQHILGTGENEILTEASSEMGDTDSDESATTNENMEDMMERLLRKYDRRGSKRLKEELGPLKSDLEKLRKELKPVFEIVKKVSQLETQINKTGSRMSRMEREDRKNNMIVHGLSEASNETYHERHLAIQELANRLKLKEIDYSESRRLGSKAAKKPRPLLIRFIRYRDKAEVLAQSKLLRGSSIAVSDDLSHEERRSRAILNSKRKEIISKDKKAVCRIRNGTLFVTSDDHHQQYHVNETSNTLEEGNSRSQQSSMEY
jgi:hypothetical protein